MIADWLVDILSIFPDWLIVFLLSMIPFTELRLSIPIGMATFGMEWYTVLPIAIIGNMVPVPFILVLFKKVEAWLRRFNIFERIFTWLFARTRSKAAQKIKKWEEVGLILFVAIPLPGTGAWTGSLIAYLFGLENKRSLIFIFIGVAIAGLAVTGIMLAGLSFLGI